MPLIASGLLRGCTNTGSDSSKSTAAALLWRFVLENPSNHDQISRAGTTEQLITLLLAGTSDAKAYALWALSLCINETSGATVIEQGGVAPLIQAMNSDQPEAREQAAAALASLAASQGTVGRKAIASGGGIAPLVSILADEAGAVAASVATPGHVARAGSAAGRQFAAAALSELALENESTRGAIVGAYGLSPLISLLRQVRPTLSLRFLNGDLL